MDVKEVLQKVLKLQGVEYDIYGLERKLRELPEERNANEKVREKKQVELKVHQDKLEEFRTAETKSMGIIEQHTKKITGLEEKEKLIKTQKEFEALDSERQSNTESLGEEERKRKEISTKIANLEKDVRERISEIEKLEQKIQTFDENMKGEIEELNKKLDELKEKRNSMTAGIPLEMLDKFERIVRMKDGIGIVRLDESICSGCYVTVPPQAINNIGSFKEISYCPTCARILYPPGLEEATPTES